MNRSPFALAAVQALLLACGGSEAPPPPPPHDPRFDQCVKLGTYKVEVAQTSASGNNCNATSSTYTSTLINVGEGSYSLKYYWPTPTLGCILNFEINPSDCSATSSRSDCSNLGFHVEGGWSFTSTGFSGSIATSWDYSSSNKCSESETVVATLQ